jgi:hypothetical protein
VKSPPSLDSLKFGSLEATAVLARIQSLLGAKCVAEVSVYADLIVYAKISESAAAGKLPAVINYISAHGLECAIDEHREGMLRFEISTRFG